jgi:allophanate hydrolase
VSIFALTAEDAGAVLTVAQGFDSEDPFSRHLTERPLAGRRFGVPHGAELQFFGDDEYARLFDQAIAQVESLGGSVVRIDFSPFLEAARLLYGGPWVAERYAALEDFIRRRPDALHPVTRAVLESSSDFSAVDAFKGFYRLTALKRASERVWDLADVLLMPTAGTVYEIASVEADPIRLNTNLGYYTNFMNLMDLAGVAVPTGFRTDGLPFGVTLVGRCGADASLLEWAGRLHRASVQRLGALNLPHPAPHGAQSSPPGLPPMRRGFMPIAVCGAHMQGLPLNHQLLERGGHLVKLARTSAHYRLFALPGEPARPGLVRDSNGGGSIEIEVWAVRSADLGSFVEGIPSPLGLGKIELEGGETVTGFVCESHATVSAADITALEGWRAYLAGSVGRR